MKWMWDKLKLKDKIRVKQKVKRFDLLVQFFQPKSCRERLLETLLNC